jgi:hypothetical protein
MESDLELKRRVARALAVFAVAIGMGHVVQTMSERNKIAAEMAAVQTVAAAQPKAVIPVAAGPQRDTVVSQPTAVNTLAVPSEPDRVTLSDTVGAPAVATMAKPVEAALLPGLGATPMAAPDVATASTPETMTAPVAPATQTAIVTRAEAGQIVVASVEPQASIVPKSMEPLLAPESACGQEMDLTAAPNAMIDIALDAACHPNERLVLRHEGLSVTIKTTATGTAFVQIPAMDSGGNVVARFADGTEIKGQIAVPDMAGIRRFAVEWMADDTFAVHAFENGAGYGDAGHVSSTNPGKQPRDSRLDAGYLMILGDDGVVQPMLAEVYTYPKDALAKVEVSVEADVTKATCGRELLGEAITSTNGVATLVDLTLAMPDCSALGDVIVLRDMVSDLTMVASK